MAVLEIDWASTRKDGRYIYIGEDQIFLKYTLAPYGLVLISKFARHVYPWHTIDRLEIRQ